MTAMLLDRLVFSKPYFEQAGLIIATDNDRAIGFAHAGFGPVDDESALSTEIGSSILAVVRPTTTKLQSPPN